MADRLTVQVKLDTTQAKKNLADLISQMKKAEESGAKFKKSLSTSANVVGDLTKVDKAISGITTESNKADASMKKLKGSADSLGSSFEKAGSKFAKTFGSNLQSSLSRSIGLMKQLASTALFVGGAVSGISVGKALADYTEFSKRAGTVNAIVGGDAKTQRLIENSLLGATAGTTQKSGDIVNSALSFASTPMFNPSEGGKYNRNDKQYQENVMRLGPITQKAGAFASSQGTDIKTIMDGAMLIATAQGDNLKDISKGGGLEKTLDWMNGLANVSVGDPGAIFANISKFAGTAHAAGVDMNTAGSLYASLTPTFTEDESGVRTNSIINWAMRASKTEGRLKDVDPAFAKKFDALVYSKGADGKEYKNSIDSIIMGATKLLADPSLGVRERDKLTAAMDPEVRQGQGRNTAAGAISSGMYDNIQKQMNNTKGLAAQSVASFNESSGAKISMFFNGMESGLQATTGALIDLFSAPEKFEIKSWQAAMGGIGQALKDNLGEGAAKPIEALQSLVEYLNTDSGKEFTNNLGNSAIELGKAVHAVGSTIFSIVTSKEAQSFMGFVSDHPIWSIAIGTVGMDIAKAGIQSAVQAAIAGGFATPIVLSIATIVVGKMIIDFLEDRSKKTIDAAIVKENDAAAQAAKTGSPIDKLKARQASIAREYEEKQSTAPSALFRDPGAYARTVGQNIGNFMNYMLPNFIKEEDADRYGIKEPNARKQFIDNYGQADWTGLKNSYNSIQKIIDNKTPISMPGSIGADASGALIKSVESILGGQDKKVGEGADKMSKAASDWAGPMAMMIQVASQLSSAAAHLGSLQIPTAIGGGTNTLASNSADKFRAQGSAEAHIG